MAHFIVAIESYVGDDTSREQTTWRDSGTPESAPALYAVVRIDASGACIVDDGYGSRQEAQQAWPDAT